MFESLRYRWTSKQVAVAAIVTLLLVLFAVLFSIQAGALSSGRVTRGVVLSAGAISVAGVCGGTREVASVQLSKGRVVEALVISVGPLQPGTPVTLRQQSSSCNPTAYEIVASK